MPALLPIILTVSHVLLAADTVPKSDVERTCRPAAAVGLPGRTAAACQHDENDARTRLEHEWTRYNAAQSVSASILLGSIVCPATLNCGPAWR
jgi:hypothetical protein